jgi:long-chain acyl-CoA synthetase
VGIFPSSVPAQVRAILDDAQPVLALTDAADACTVLAGERDGLGLFMELVGPAQGREPGWESWLADGREALAKSSEARAAVRQRTAALSLDDIAALICTSGSTGEPKGAMISRRYLAASARSIAMVLDLGRSDRTVSFRPFSHAAERVFGECTRVHPGMPSALVEDPA